MGRLVRINPATEEKNSQAAVVATGAHGRLVRTGDVQRTSPVGNTVKLPSAQSVYQKALDEAMMKRAAADQKNKERGRKSYNRTHAQEVREITGDKTKKSITPIIKSAAAGYAADMVGAADTLLRAPSGLNYAASQERGEIEASKKNIAAYTEKLKAAKTEEERQQWQTLIDRNKRLIEINSKAAGERAKNYQDATRGAQEKLQDTYQKLRKIASDNMEKANEGLTPVGKYLNNVGVAGAQMAADAALGGGSALGPMFLRVFGGNSQEAAEAADKPGMSAAEQLDAQNRALLYGTASGAVSIATEKISNVAAPFKKAFGGGFLDKAIDGAIAKMNGNAAGRLALSFLSEGGEEVIEDIVQPALQTIYTKKRHENLGEYLSELDAAEILNDFLVGGALGLIGSGVEGIHKADARLAAERAAGEAAAPTAEQQNTMPAQPAAAQEGAQGAGEGNSVPVPQSAAQGAQEAKADALETGGRVPLDQYATPENANNDLTVMQGIADTIGVSDATRVWEFAKNNKDELIEKALGGVCSAYENEARAEGDIDFAPAINDINLFYSIDTFDTLTDRFEEEYIKKYNEVPSAAEKAALLMVAVQEGVNEGYIAQSSNGWYTLTDKGMHKVYDDIGGIEDYILDRRGEMLDGKLEHYSSIDWGNAEVTDMRDSRKGKLSPKGNAAAEIGAEKSIYDMPEGQNGGIDHGGQEVQNHAGGAEFADTAKRGTPEAADAARALPDGAAERGERERGGRESGRIPREVRNVGGEDGNALTVQKRLAASGISQFISPREANVPNGASGSNTVTIFEETDWDPELINAANWAKSKGVKKVTALLGVINIEKNGRTGKAFGVFNADTGEIFVNAGSMQRSVSETIEHETAHYLAEVARRENVRTFMRDVQSRYSSEEWGKVYDAYFDRYAALTGDYAGMSENDIELYVWEEIMGDAYAEIDQYDEKASRFNREAENALSQSGQESKNALQAEGTQGAAEQGRETAAATERRTGPPERFSYAGRDARNADLEALHEAERYEMQNVDAETIRQKTGWFRGADGKWRWEIDDSGMKLRTDAADISNYTTLGELVDAPALFATYPDMKDMSVTFHNLERGQLGGYHRTFDSIELSRELKQKPEALLNSLIHEVQHAIQQREGFTPGANPKYWNRKLEEGYDGRDAETRREGARLREQYERMGANDPEFMRSMEELNAMAPTVPRGKVDMDTWEQVEPDPPEWVRFDERRDQLEEKYGDRVWDYFSLRDSIDRNARDGRLPGDLYRDTAGEIEARDAAARRGLTAEERRGRKPDTGDENTVFADRSGWSSYSEQDSETSSIKEQIENSREKLNAMGLVARASVPTDLKSKDAAAQWAAERLKSSGYKVDRQGYGDIYFSKKDMDKGLRYADTAEEKAALAVLPQVLKRGIEIGGHANHKGRTKQTITFAAPVELNGTRGNMAVVVNKNGNHYYAHRIVLPDGTAFRFSEEGKSNAAQELSRGVTVSGSLADTTSAASENSIPKDGKRVKYSAFNEEVARQLAGEEPKQRFSAEDTTDSAGRELTVQQQEYFKDSKVRDEDGRLKVMYHRTNADKPFTVFDTYGGKFGLFGRGSYFTDDPEVAHSYTAKGKGKAPRTYEVYLDIKNPLDMDAAFDRSAWTDQPTDIRDAIAGATTNEDVFRALKQYCEDEGMIRWEAEDFISDTVRSAGFDGITHVGGGRYGSKDGQKHRVFIAFDPEQIKRVDNKTPTDDPDIRFSAEDEGDEWNRELERMPESVQEAVRRVKGSRGSSMREFPNLDAYLSDKGAQLAAEKAERLRNRGKDEFGGTKALEKLGVKIENSAGDYSVVDQLIANDQAAKTIQRETRKAIKRLGATPKEQNFARNIASGLYDEEDIPTTMNRGKVMQLADYYSAEKSMSTDLIKERRREISERLQEKMEDLFDERFEGEFTAPKRGKGIAPESGLALYHRTPQRSMRAIFGWDRGQQINEAIFEPVYVNEQERKRFVNRMHDEVRTFKGADGEDAALTQRERALAQLMIEGKAVEEMVGKSEIKQQIIHAAENLLDGAEMTDAAREFGLHGKEERELAQRYADWLETKRELDSGSVDKARVENAAKKYSGLYDEFYAAINDFLVAHGYEPIGFIKGYAPHFQPEAESGKLESALKAIGVDLGAEVGKLPASIAGLTKEFKPNKRYNPFFQHRKGTSTDYDIQKGFEKYIDYLSDVLYHTDDVMRVRAAAKYFRRKYAPDDISALIEQAEDLKFATPEEKELFLKTNGIVDDDVKLSYQAMNRAMEQYTEGLFNDVTQTTKYGDLVTWLDDYGNKLAGKQLFNDRSMEREVGRTSLNVGRKLVSTFARANVAGNLSSSLNQTAQLPLIAGELGPKYVAEAIGDIASGKAKGDFADRSDFLTEKRGIRYLTNTKGDKFTTALFWPLERMDYLMSTIAVRGRYRKELAEGKSEKEALRAADRWGRDVMGSRSKGTAPLTFQSKNLISQMVNLFQVEALNSWEHVSQDIFGPGLREMEAKLGKKEASRRLAGIIVGTLLGAFLLNRVDEELYGGTPAQFDVLGLLAGFLASGNGLTTNEQLGVWFDDVWQKMTGERLFGTDEDAGNDKFNLAAAAEDTLYNISNDVPYVRNMAGLMGWGDQTLPMPDIVGALSKGKKALKNADSPGEFWAEVARQLMGLAGDTLPGGRQAEKTAQGIEAVARGGSYKGSGDSKRLQYPVESPLEDPWTALRAAIFGKNALPESRTYWAAGGKALSAAQTRLYEDLVDSGLSRKRAYEILKRFNDATADLEADRDKNGNPIGGSKKEKIVTEINKLPLSRKQKNMLYLSRGYSEKDLNSLPWN